MDGLSDGRGDGRTDGQTSKHAYRVARTHLKRVENETGAIMRCVLLMQERDMETDMERDMKSLIAYVYFVVIKVCQ